MRCFSFGDQENRREDLDLFSGFNSSDSLVGERKRDSEELVGLLFIVSDSSQKVTMGGGVAIGVETLRFRENLDFFWLDDNEGLADVSSLMDFPERDLPKLFFLSLLLSLSEGLCVMVTWSAIQTIKKKIQQPYN